MKTIGYDFSICKQPSYHFSLLGGWWCYIDGSWKKTDKMSGFGWYYFKDGLEEKILGARNVQRSLPPLHAELEGLLWAILCMSANRKMEVAFATDCSELVKMLLNFFLKRKSSSTSEVENNLDYLPWDPFKRKQILEYHQNQRDEKCDSLMKQNHYIEHAFYKQDDVAKMSIVFAEQNEVVSKVVLENAPKNNQMTSPLIQKDIVHCFAEEVVKSTIEETNYERFIGVVHVRETSSLTLKHVIDVLFAKYGLSLKNIRGQGYDGASNMKVAIAKKHFEVGDFFDKISTVSNVVGASCKRKDKLQEIYQKEITKEISDGKICTGKGKNQNHSLSRHTNTRWGSHHKKLLRLVELFSIVIKVFGFIQSGVIENSKKRQAYGLASYMQTFYCIFYMHLMLHILGQTENLSMALQTIDQNILNAVSLVEYTKRELQKFRDDGWDSLMVKVSSFCKKHDIDMIMMEDEFVDFRRLRKKINTTNLHHYKISCFNVDLDLQLQEFNDRFIEVNT
ncbi:hypothetical protein EUTSA_v10023166mg [Eutrema salsugineum]|uniref:DUF4371 domain-containing protein n=1 Tax=Eutrema salsugineum TaxID=72664 RepID=V4NW66_EUTSA|nr:hypothetical protein EUTSA_v10023166mg [Eutrema salsugineum]